jgi:hypothetical protein
MENLRTIANHALCAVVDILEVANGDCERTLYRNILICEAKERAWDVRHSDGIERCLVLCRDRIDRQACVIENLKAISADTTSADALMETLIFTEVVLDELRHRIRG